MEEVVFFSSDVQMSEEEIAHREALGMKLRNSQSKNSTSNTLVDNIRPYNIHDFPPNSMYRKRLYIPTNPTHAAWDCIYDDGKRTAFFSFSVSDFATHETTTLKSLQGGIIYVYVYLYLYLYLYLSIYIFLSLYLYHIYIYN